MQTEVEAKFPDIEPRTIREKLKSLGAKLEYPERSMRRMNFDYEDAKLEKIGGWIRVRDEGNKTTLTYKQLKDRTLHGTKEIEVIVDSFDKMNELLKSVGLKEKAYQETKREKWKLGETEITIDTWPWVPTFIEVEATDESTLKNAVAALGLDWGKAMHGSVETIYQMHYNFTEEEIINWKSITFIPEPDWLLAKKR